MRSFWFWTLILLLGLALAWSAHAEAPATGPVLTPPELASYAEAAYPESARGEALEATVELELDVDAEGVVTAVRVATPAGHGFDEAALEAARGLRFVPAKSDGQPVAARIRFRYAFAPPAQERPPATGALRGTVLDVASGQPVAFADVVVTDGAGERHATITDARGTFAFDGLPEGSLSLRIAALDKVALESSETVSAGELVELTFRLSPVASTKPASSFGAVARVEAPAREVVRRSVAKEELWRMAGTRGDAMRTIELLPGVARPPMGLGMVLIRGSAPGDSQVFLDGAPIYNLYHFGGLTSVVQSQLLSGIDLYPGNFSVRYGRKVGGVIESTIRDPRTDALHGMIDVNLIDASLLVETPITDELSIAVAARRSYLDAWFARMAETAELSVVAAPVYYDYQGVLTWKPSARDRVRVLGYGSYDELTLVLNDASEQDPSIRGKIGSSNAYHRGQLEWHRTLSSRVESDVMLGAGPMRLSQRMGPDFGYVATGFDAVARTDLRVRLWPRLRLDTGLDVQLVRVDVDFRGPQVTPSEGDPASRAPLTGRAVSDVETTATYVRPAAYGALVTQVTDELELTTGARVDYFGDIDAYAVDPRLQARLALGRTTLRAGVGRFSQPPQLHETLPRIGNPKLGATHALHYGVGIDEKLTERAQLSLDGFYKTLDGLTVSNAQGELRARGVGRIYGAELAGRINPGGRVSGFLSYTLSRSERNDRNGRGERLFDYDQTHILTTAANCTLGRGWLLGGTFRLASGNPDTPVVGSVYDADHDVYQPLYGRTNSTRNPTFHRLDLRVEKKWTVGRGSVTAYLDLQNVYNRQNREGTRYNYDYSQRREFPGLPILPSLGLRGEL